MEWVRMTAAEYRAQFNKKNGSVQKNKYNAKKVKINGVQFDSKKELARFRVLEQRALAGEIKDLQRQVKFELQPSFRNNQGKAIRAINYICDFLYFDTEKNVWIVEDVKGSKATLTESYKLKAKLFQYKYPDYLFVEVM